MIQFLVSFLILVLVLGAIWYIISLLPLPSPFDQIIRVVFVVITVILVIYMLLGLVGQQPYPLLR